MDIVQQFLGDEFLSKAFILTILTGALVYFKQIPNQIWSRIRRKIVFSVTIEQTDELFDYIDKWLMDKHSKKHRNVLAYINYRNLALGNHYPENEVTRSSSNNNNTKVEKEIVKYRHKEDLMFLYMYGSWIKINKGRDKLDNAKSLTSLFFDSYTVSVFFYKNKIKQLLTEITDYNQQFKDIEDKVSIYIPDYSHWHKLRSLNTKRLNDIIIKKSVKDMIVNDFDRFEVNKDWYLKRSIPYKRGYLFYGSPGNGKTSMAMSLANHFNKDIHVITLSEVDGDNSLRGLFMNIKNNSILLLEDVDAAFKERKGLIGITFSTLLNCLDGVYYKEGVVTIMTTNHREKLDNALIRDGRIDVHVEFINPEQQQVREYVELFYGINLNGESYNGSFSMASIQNHCLNNSKENIKKELFS